MKNPSRFTFSRLALPCALSALGLLGACQTKPLSPEKITQQVVVQRPPAPEAVVSDMEHCLAWLGDQLREQPIAAQLAGYSAVADTSGKTGVDFALVMRSALLKVVSRGSALSITSMGFGPANVENQELGRSLVHLQRLVRADWLITGGTTSVTNAFIAIQTSGGMTSRALDLARAGTAQVDLASLSFALKWAESGIDMPLRSIDVRVSYQATSNATEVGLFAQASINGKKLNSGLRASRTATHNQVTEDAIRFAIEWAVANLLATRFSVDLAACPLGALTPENKLPKAENRLALPSLPELAKFSAGLSAEERIRWYQATLAARGYAPGPVDGKPGTRTREATARAQQDLGLPPTGVATDALFFALARRELAEGRDPRKPREPAAAATAAPTARIAVQLSPAEAQLVAGTAMRGTAVPPQAGYLHCWLSTPEATMPLYPLAPNRAAFVTARNAVALPGNQAYEGGQQVRLSKAGLHEVWCGQSRKSVVERLPAELRAGGDKPMPAAAIREAFASAAAADWLAEGAASFNVVAAAQSR